MEAGTGKKSMTSYKVKMIAPVDLIKRLKVQDDGGHDGAVHVVLPELGTNSDMLRHWKGLHTAKVTTQYWKLKLIFMHYQLLPLFPVSFGPQLEQGK